MNLEMQGKLQFGHYNNWRVFSGKVKHFPNLCIERYSRFHICLMQKDLPSSFECSERQEWKGKDNNHSHRHK